MQTMSLYRSTYEEALRDTGSGRSRRWGDTKSSARRGECFPMGISGKVSSKYERMADARDLTCGHHTTIGRFRSEAVARS